MVSRQIVLDTVKRMHSSGVDDNTIRSTLRDIGLSEGDIEGYLREVKGISEQKPAEKEPRDELFEGDSKEEDQGIEEESPQDEGEMEFFQEDEKEEQDSLAEKTVQKIKEHLDDHFSSRELSDASALNAIEEHGQKVGEMHKKIDELHEKISESTVSPELFPKINAIEKKLVDLEKQLVDIKASQNALSSLLAKILETNKSILNKKK